MASMVVHYNPASYETPNTTSMDRVGDGVVAAAPRAASRSTERADAGRSRDVARDRTDGAALVSGNGTRSGDRRAVRRVDARISGGRSAAPWLRAPAPAEIGSDAGAGVHRAAHRARQGGPRKGRRVVGARRRVAPRDPRRRVRESRRPRPAAPPTRPARRGRPDGVLFPEQRGERRLLQRDDQSRGVQTDRDHDEEARTARLKASRYNGLSGERVREAFRRAGARGFQPSAETRMPTHESDVCIIGGGITSAMLAQKLSELRPSLHITVVEAGRSIFDVENRGRYRERAIAYGEHPWPDDYVEDQQAEGIISMTMAVGGLALHWGGACNRFSEEDLRLKSMYGLAVDWPIEWRELERYYCEAERRLNVAGEPSAYPQDKRTEPYPQPPIPLSFNLQLLKRWAEQSGL
ncbi:MAG: hypothetical protein DMG00_00160, partial [Acidobacteria bacterium]